MQKAEDRNHTKAVDALVAKADPLAQQIGPDYLKIVEGLEQVDPNSVEGQRLAAVFNSLREKCKQRGKRITLRSCLRFDSCPGTASPPENSREAVKKKRRPPLVALTGVGAGNGEEPIHPISPHRPRM
jgi:hypothetical protein